MLYKVILTSKKAGEQSPDLETLTKNELIKMLENKGIEFNPRSRKNELIQLLQGGD